MFILGARQGGIRGTGTLDAKGMGQLVIMAEKFTAYAMNDFLFYRPQSLHAAPIEKVRANNDTDTNVAYSAASCAKSVSCKQMSIAR